MIATVVKLVIKFGVAILICDLVDYMFGGCSDHFSSLITQLPGAVINSIVSIFGYIMKFFVAILDGFISLIWNQVPGLSDVFDAPSVGDIIN